MDITRRPSMNGGANSNNGSEVWPDHARHQCKLWVEHATRFRWAFYDEQMRKKRVHTIMKYAQGVLLALAPTTSFADWMSVFEDSTRLTVCGIIGTLALLLKFMINASALETYIGKCEHAIREYDGIINDINNQLLTRTQENWEDLFIRITRKFTEVSASSPALPFKVLTAQGIIDREGKPVAPMFVSVSPDLTPQHERDYFPEHGSPLPPSPEMIARSSSGRPPSPTTTMRTTREDTLVVPSPIPRVKGTGTPQRTSLLKRVQSLSGASSSYGMPMRSMSGGSTNPGPTLQAASNRLEDLAAMQTKSRRRAIQRQQAHMATRMPLLNVLVEHQQHNSAMDAPPVRRTTPHQSWHIPLQQSRTAPPPVLSPLAPTVDALSTPSGTSSGGAVTAIAEEDVSPPAPPTLNLRMPLSSMVGQPLEQKKM